ncbi:MAG: deoxyhypusine synthase family protein [Rhodothermia bacterium]|nr:deoxyhypusine synthase family protein [Rhodothermia bacterium]
MVGTPVTDFVDRHYRHFNAAALRDAARAYVDLLDGGGRMMITLAGAMSTAEMGLSLAEMIRRGCVHAISCTGANLEEDLFNLVAHDHYVRIPEYRHLTAQDEADLFKHHLNRVTDTCIPEEEAIRRIERAVLDLWEAADKDRKRYLPHQYLYRLIQDGTLEHHYQIDPRDSWLYEAAKADLPLFVPGWEDSTLGNIFAARCIDGTIEDPRTVRSGIEYMIELSDWYRRECRQGSVGFFQVGGGIAGDFPICVVPMIQQDLQIDVPTWSYFCQISDSTTSFGSYSGAVPSEKITWGKLSPDTPAFIIESDATIVAPLVFAYVMEATAGVGRASSRNGNSRIEDDGKR